MNSKFSTPEPYIAIIEALFSKKKGLTRTKIAQAIGKEEYNKFLKRTQRFQQSTNHRGGLIPTIITSPRLSRNSYAERLGVKAIDLDHLFV